MKLLILILTPNYILCKGWNHCQFQHFLEEVKIRIWPSCLLLGSEMVEKKCSVKQFSFMQTSRDATMMRQGKSVPQLCDKWVMPLKFTANMTFIYMNSV